MQEKGKRSREKKGAMGKEEGSKNRGTKKGGETSMPAKKRKKKYYSQEQMEPASLRAGKPRE
jgi:hypothetical protein